jgi:hypothetical protein
MTKFIAGPRQSGKTTKLIKWMSKAPEGVTRVLVSPNKKMADYARLRAAKLHLSFEDWQFTHPYRSPLMMRGLGPVELALDEVAFINFAKLYMAGCTIGAVSLTLGDPFGGMA